MENGPFQDVFLLKIWIFHCYISLLEGTHLIHRFPQYGIVSYCQRELRFGVSPPTNWHRKNSTLRTQLSPGEPGTHHKNDPENQRLEGPKIMLWKAGKNWRNFQMATFYSFYDVFMLDFWGVHVLFKQKCGPPIWPNEIIFHQPRFPWFLLNIPFQKDRGSGLWFDWKSAALHQNLRPSEVLSYISAMGLSNRRKITWIHRWELGTSEQLGRFITGKPYGCFQNRGGPPKWMVKIMKNPY